MTEATITITVRGLTEDQIKYFANEEQAREATCDTFGVAPEDVDFSTSTREIEED